MTTWLLTWNPRHGSGWNLGDEAARVQAGTSVPGDWSAGLSKSIEAGDLLYLLRQGREPKGVVGSARATSAVYVGKDWRDRRKRGTYVDLHWLMLLDSDDQPPLPNERLEGIGFEPSFWNTRAGGIRVGVDRVQALERVWTEHYVAVTGRPYHDLIGRAGAATGGVRSATEGRRVRQLILHQQRERALRDAKVRQATADGGGRLRCEVPGCGFDFAEAYGAAGEGFIHVHHKRPLSDVGDSTETTLDDLAVVCPNCHAMIHLGGGCRDYSTLIPARLRRGAGGE